MIELYCHFVLAFDLFQVRFNSRQLKTSLSRSLEKCARHDNPDTIFLISLESSSSFLVAFHSVFIPNNCLIRLIFSESCKTL